MAVSIDPETLERALTALTLNAAEMAALSGTQRAEILRAAATVNAELTRQVRHLTVAVRDLDGMTWGTVASHLTGDPHARSTARGTYEAGLRLRETGRTHQPDQEES